MIKIELERKDEPDGIVVFANFVNESEKPVKFVLSGYIACGVFHVVGPDGKEISGVYYGRDVGYEVRELKPPEEIATISGTCIRGRGK